MGVGGWVTCKGRIASMYAFSKASRFEPFLPFSPSASPPPVAAAFLNSISKMSSSHIAAQELCTATTAASTFRERAVGERD